MSKLMNRFIHEEDADLSAWITAVIFIAIAIAAYLMLWGTADNPGPIRNNLTRTAEESGRQLDNIFGDNTDLTED